MRSLTDWLEVVWFRRKVVAIILATILALTTVYLIFAPRTYESVASLYFDKTAPDPLRKDDDNRQAPPPSLSTEAEVVRSSRVVQRVVDRMTPAERKYYEGEWKSDAKTGESFDDWMREELLKSVTVTAEDKAQVMTIAAIAPDSADAAKLANSFATSYVETQRQLSTGPAQQYAKFLESKMSAARADVETAESELSAFVRATGISNNGNLQSDAAQAASIIAESASASGMAASTASTGGAVEQAVADAERTESIQRQNTELATKQAKVVDLESTLGPNHPTLVAARAELTGIKASLRAERSATTAAITRARQAELAAATSAAAARAAQLQSAAGAQQSKLVAMSSNLGKFTTLQQALAAAQQRYNDMSAQAAKMSLRGNLPLANVSQLDTAKAPITPKSPKIGLMLLLALLLGSAIGGAVAILLEYLNPRVRTLANVERLIGVPVVARLSLPREAPRMLTDARAS